MEITSQWKFLKSYLCFEIFEIWNIENMLNDFLSKIRKFGFHGSKDLYLMVMADTSEKKIWEI